MEVAPIFGRLIVFFLREEAIALSRAQCICIGKLGIVVQFIFVDFVIGYNHNALLVLLRVATTTTTTFATTTYCCFKVVLVLEALYLYCDLHLH